MSHPFRKAFPAGKVFRKARRIVYLPRSAGPWRARMPRIRREVEKYNRPWNDRRRARAGSGWNGSALSSYSCS